MKSKLKTAKRENTVYLSNFCDRILNKMIYYFLAPLNFTVLNYLKNNILIMTHKLLNIFIFHRLFHEVHSLVYKFTLLREILT